MKRLPDLRLLSAFVTVAREGNVTRAAERLNMTQPAVSLQLRRLARESGVTLFRRTAQGMELTRDGALLAAKAEGVIAAAAEFAYSAGLLTRQVKGKLRVGTIIDPEFTRLGAFLKAIVEAGPGLETELYHAMSGEVLAGLRKGRVDVGFFLGDPPNDEPGPSEDRSLRDPLVHSQELARLTYRVVAPPGLATLVTGRGWAELAPLPWIGTPPASVHCRLLSRIFAEAGTRQNVVALVDQEASMLEMVRAGVGLSLCREQIALREKQAYGLAIADGVSVQTALHFVCLASRRAEAGIGVAFDAIDRVWG